jgi:hypothetical protein
MKTTTITARDIQIAAAIGTMSAALGAIAGLRRNHGNRCIENITEPFQFAVGCTNRPIASWFTAGHFGRPVRARACAACLAFRVAEKLTHRNGRQRLLTDVLQSVGIENYRTWRAPTEWYAARRQGKGRGRNAA